MRKPTVYDLLQSKGKTQHLQVHVDNAEEAAACEVVGIQLIGCESDHTLDAVRKAAPLGFISAGAKHGQISTADDAVRHGFSLLARGADSVYCSSSPRFIEAMAREGIPVTGHVGLVPNWGTWTNFRAIGKTPEEALTVFRKMKEIESAGAAFVEVEVVPVKLAAYLTANTSMLTMGMGCGNVCDTQYLFTTDILGNNPGRYPRHSKKYADFLGLMAQVQQARVDALQAFSDDVARGSYPEDQHQVDVDDQTFEAFLALAERG